MNSVTLFYLLSVFTLSVLTCNAQDNNDQASWFSQHPIEFSFGSHSIGLPFNNFLSPPYYPEINIGLQSNLLIKKNINLNMVNGVGFAAHPFSGNRYSINTFLRFKYQFPLNIYGQIGLGPSLNILTYPNDVYELNSKGIYEEGNSMETKLYGGFNMEIGYRLKSIRHLELDLFLKYNAGVDFFHHPEIPIFPYNSTQIGTRFYINQNN